jgi:dethiobiotin synthetase
MTKHKHIWIAGIHTDAGKTVSSGLIALALGADYWKPVQAGGLENSDSHRIQNMLKGTPLTIHPEAFRLSQPMSPHAAARIDQVNILIEDIKIPTTDRNLVIETAGGLYSPLNETMTMLDLMRAYPAPVVLVSRHYVGSINHTLMSLELLEANGMAPIGLIISDEENTTTEEFIALRKPQYPHFRLGRIDENNTQQLQEVAQQLQHTLATWLT